MSEIRAADLEPASVVLDRILAAGAAFRRAENSPLWKIDMEAAIEAAGAAADAVWLEINNRLSALDRIGRPVAPNKPAKDPRKEMAKRMASLLRAELPKVVAAILMEISDDEPVTS